MSISFVFGCFMDCKAFLIVFPIRGAFTNGLKTIQP